MLDAMRKRANSWFIRALLLVLIVSFAVWGIGDMFLGRQDTEVAMRVGDIEVPLRDVEQAFESDRQALQQQLGSSIDRRQAASLGLLNRALQTLSARAVVDQHRRDLGLGVADAEVASVIRRDPFFASAGSFDRLRFDSFLRSTGQSEARYVETVRADIGRSRVVAGLSGLTAAPEPLVERLGAFRGETRGGTVLVVPRAGITVGEPDDAALQALLDADADRFTAPAFRDVSLVLLTAETLVDEIEIDEARLRAEYEQRRAFYTQPERRRVGQLLAGDREVIDAARAALEDGAVFAELAQSMSAEGLTYSTLGPVREDDLPPELAASIFALGEDEVSEPVESLFGWHLFRVIEVEPEVVRGFDEVREDLRLELARERAIDELPDLAAALDDGIAGGETLEEAAAAVGVPVRRLEAVDASGRGPDGQPVEGGTLEQAILSSIFAAPVGEVSLLEESPQGAFYMFRVDAEAEPRPWRLDEVRDELVALWREREQNRLAAERATRIMADVRSGRRLETVAENLGDEVVLRRFEPITRNDPGEAAQLMPEAVTALFATTAGEVAPNPVPTADGMAILRADSVELPQAAALDGMREQLRAGLESDILTQYEAALRARIPVEINNAAIASLFPEETF